MCWVFLGGHGLSLVVTRGCFSLLCSRCSLCWLLVAEHRFGAVGFGSCCMQVRWLWLVGPRACVLRCTGSSCLLRVESCRPGTGPESQHWQVILVHCAIGEVLIHSWASVLGLLQFPVTLKLLFQALLTSSKLLNANSFLQHFQFCLRAFLFQLLWY